MCKFNTKITIALLLRLTIVSASQKFTLLGLIYPDNSIVLEIAATLLIALQNSCRFWDSFC